MPPVKKLITLVISLRMLVQGDDNLMRYVKTEVIDWVGYMLEFGFTSEAVYRPTIFAAEFCSNLVYMCNKGLVFGPKVGRVIAKLAYYINPPLKVLPASIVRGTALGLYNACSCIPPLRVYLDRLLDLTDKVVPHRTGFDEWKMKYSMTEPVPETEVTLDLRYGWTGACQHVFKEGLENASLGCEFSHPLFDLLCDRDTAAPNAVYLNLE